MAWCGDDGRGATCAQTLRLAARRGVITQADLLLADTSTTHTASTGAGVFGARAAAAFSAELVGATYTQKHLLHAIDVMDTGAEGGAGEGRAKSELRAWVADLVF